MAVVDILIAMLLFGVCTLGSSPTMAPAMVWSGSKSCSSSSRGVNYEIVPSHEIQAVTDKAIGAALEQCGGKLIVEFIGNELRSADMTQGSSETVNVLKDVIQGSHQSLVLPYVSYTNDGSAILNDFLDKYTGDSHALYGCPGADETMKVLGTSSDMQEYVTSSMSREAVSYLLVCSSSSGTSEGALLKSILSLVENSGADYIASYVSDPSLHYMPHRLLAVSNGTVDNSSGSSNTTAPYCDDVCRTKATLLEAILVAIVLLVILISGLCCMMGIQTPIRFEKPHES